MRHIVMLWFLVMKFCKKILYSAVLSIFVFLLMLIVGIDKDLESENVFISLSMSVLLFLFCSFLIYIDMENTNDR